MQAVILAAGLGRRLGQATRQSTKCMVRLNGRRLVEYALDALVAVGVERIVVVVGHGADEVRAFLGEQQAGIPIHYVVNPVYAETNNIYSLLLAREYLEQDETLLLESDIVFDPTILRDCVDHPAPNLAVVARYEDWMDGTVTLLDAEQRIVRIVARQEFSPRDSGAYFKTVNIYKLSQRFCRDRFMPFLAAYMSLEGRGHYYEDVLRVLVFMDADHLVALPVGEKLWYEIDDAEDLDIASVLFAAEDERFDRLQRRYGGYWRFPRLTDFNYLVNPFFPPRRFLEELSEAAPRLAQRYPSGSAVQRLLGAKLLGCEPAEIVVGNGASELIRAVVAEIDGPIGVAAPTFEEYAQSIGPDRLRMLPAERPDAPPDLAELARACREHALAALVLVNPNNPTGLVLSRQAVLSLLEELRSQGVLLILDESFVDFVDGTPAWTLLHDDLLAAYPNLVLVRSLGKSYGIAGLRLGLLASGNHELVDRVARRLPIWNVNSLAEWFLQMVGRYESDYWESCRRLVAARAHLFAGLSQSPCLRPIESQANFVLCEVRDGWTAAGLGRRLLAKHWLLIKDCTGKSGMGSGEYVRIAVRTELEQDELLHALAEIPPDPPGTHRAPN